MDHDDTPDRRGCIDRSHRKNDRSTYSSAPQNMIDMTTFEGSAKMGSSAFCVRCAPMISEIVHDVHDSAA
jgi:hypothetical protein